MSTAHGSDGIPNDLERHFPSLRSPYGCYIFSTALGIELPSKEDCIDVFFLAILCFIRGTLEVQNTK